MILVLKVIAWFLVNGLTLMIAARLAALGVAQSRSMTVVLWTFWWIFVDTTIVLVLGMAGLLNVLAIMVATVCVAIVSGACSRANWRFMLGFFRSSFEALRTLAVCHPLYSAVWALMRLSLLRALCFSYGCFPLMFTMC